MLYTFLLVVHAIIAAILVAVILMQRSEGGGLGVGGSPAGVMSARGAADFLTRGTAILATLFVLMSIGLAALATVERAPRDIDTSLARTAPAAPASDVPLADPLAPAAAGLPPVAAPAPSAVPQPAPLETSTRATAPDAPRRSEAPARQEKASAPASAPVKAPAVKALAAVTKAPESSATPLVLPPRSVTPAPQPSAPAPAADTPAPSAD